MPIEIRELVIKATVKQETESATANTSTVSNNSDSVSVEIINSCVDKVLEILKEKHER